MMTMKEQQTNTIYISITFYSPWHCGSGLSAGADVDELVVKDKDGLPYIPGKTLKGLIREATENYIAISGADHLAELLPTAFGTELSGVTGTTGCLHFSNATLSETERTAIVGHHAQDYLYNKVTTTAIGDDGVAKDHSLRSMEVVVPCEMHAIITGVPAELREAMVKSFGWVKRLGQKRNRGLGRCDIREEATR